MNYWDGATGYKNMCECGVTNSCSNGNKCNCYNSAGGWAEDSGLLTDRQVRFTSDSDQTGRFRSFQWGRLSQIRQTQMLWTSMMNLLCYKHGPFVERNKLCANYFCKDKTCMLHEKVVRWSIKTHRNLDGILNKISSNFLKQKFFLKSVTKTGDFCDYRLERIRILLITFNNYNKLVHRVLNQVWNI